MAQAKPTLPSIDLVPQVEFTAPIYVATRKATPLPSLEMELAAALEDAPQKPAPKARKSRGRRQ
jgi:hypothetical protein